MVAHSQGKFDHDHEQLLMFGYISLLQVVCFESNEDLEPVFFYLRIFVSYGVKRRRVNNPASADAFLMLLSLPSPLDEEALSPLISGCCHPCSLGFSSWCLVLDQGWLLLL